jgi:murein DD-endopeptidase MepM/ murein hydrolase activator NlpD
VPYGENLRSLSRAHAIPMEKLAQLNHLTSPQELYAGFTLVIPENSNSQTGFGRSALNAGQSLLELAALSGSNPWMLALSNQLSGASAAMPGDVLITPVSGQEGPGALPGTIRSIEIDPAPLLQGKAAAIELTTQGEVSLEGELIDRPMHFYQNGENRYVALQGVHALSEPGLYPLEIKGETLDGATFAFSQMVPVGEMNYPYDTPLNVDPATIDPAVTKPEDEQWKALMAPATPERLWEGVFKLPSPLPADYCLETGECWSSRFGNRRSYNGSPYQYFHTGLDVVGKPGTEIYAPAAGEVVFAGPLTVRGNATVINHGWGVYTAYMHQSEILVEVGDQVEAGQLIGLVGGTGRAEGPHLHWEVWAGGVQVDPLDWLKQAYP